MSEGNFDPVVHDQAYMTPGGPVGIGIAVYKPRNVEDAMSEVLKAIRGGSVRALAPNRYEIATNTYGDVQVEFPGQLKDIDPNAVAKAFDLPLAKKKGDLSAGLR